MKRALRIAVTFVDGDPHMVIAHDGTGAIDDNLVTGSNTEKDQGRVTSNAALGVAARRVPWIPNTSF